MKAKDPSELDRLRTRIAEAMARDRPRVEVMPLLTQLLAHAGDQGELYVFAHRQMAELCLQSDPWHAALHLRRVIKANAGDDTVHALMGLCQALLGNFDSAVHHYERALRLEPENAWYHHNLGHLLDVALGKPAPALSHLRRAHEAHPVEDEVTASLAHCLARLEHLAEAEILAREACDLSPEHGSHSALLAWIRSGAPGGYLFSADQSLGGQASRRRSKSASSSGEPRGRRPERGQTVRAIEQDQNDSGVLSALAEGMASVGATATLIGRAERLWQDYRSRRPDVRVQRPQVHAAALEYAVSVLHGMVGITQTGIAKRYGVSAGALSSRYTDMRVTLELTVGDPRYLR